jgi:hypothetical protein
MGKSIRVQGLKKMKIGLVTITDDDDNEMYCIGVKHNLPRKAFQYFVKNYGNCVPNQDLSSDELVRLINTAPEDLNYRADSLTVDDKIMIEKTFEPNVEIVWK